MPNYIKIIILNAFIYALMCIIVYNFMCSSSYGSNKAVNYRVDMIELNHMKNNHTSYHQIILWEYSHDYHRFDVMQWYTILDSELEWSDKLPYKLPNGNTAVKWPYLNKIVVVESKIFRETWTYHDPELENKKLLPIEKRNKVLVN